MSRTARERTSHFQAADTFLGYVQCGNPEKYMKCTWFTRSARAVLTKVAIDQLCYTPVAIGIFYGTLNTLEGRPLDLPDTMRVSPAPQNEP